jgi:hypothetical protein
MQVSVEGKQETGTGHDQAEVTVHGGGGQDAISVTAGSAANVNIYGDASDDTISVTGGAEADEKQPDLGQRVWRRRVRPRQCRRAGGKHDPRAKRVR